MDKLLWRVWLLTVTVVETFQSFVALNVDFSTLQTQRRHHIILRPIIVAHPTALILALIRSLPFDLRAQRRQRARFISERDIM